MELHHEKKTPRDGEYVQAYLETHSQTKAAQKCGVGRETIARAVRRSGVALDGRKLNGQNQVQSKISDNRLINEAQTLNCVEIAFKYHMTPERVFRRARKLGISVSSRGTGGHYKERCNNNHVAYDYTITLNAVRKRDNDICQICGKRVDDTDIENGHIRKMYPTIDHIIPLVKGGTHTWGNVQLAHMACNSGKCDKLNYTVKREEVWT